MSHSYIKLCCAAFLPVLFSLFLYLLDKKTAFGRLHNHIRQLIYGLIFGMLSIIGTEWGFPMEGNVHLNCRDAAVLTAGLFFGAPAGVLAGLIGGIERWFSVAWGISRFGRVACSLSAVVAGLYSATLRKIMFEEKKPECILSLAIGVVMEVLHLTLVFLTNMSATSEAVAFVKACTIPLVAINSCSVSLSSLALTFASGDHLTFFRHEKIRITQAIQRWLLLTVIVAFLLTSAFVTALQNAIANRQADSLLNLALDEISSDIRDASNQSLLQNAHKVAEEIDESSLKTVAFRHAIAEINVVDRSGKIVDSTTPEYLGYDMAGSEQSAPFLCLLDDTEEYAQEYGPIALDNTIMRKYVGVKTDDGFIQIGYDGIQFQREIDNIIIGLSKNRHVGESGYILILDEQKNLTSAPQGVTQYILNTASDSFDRYSPDDTFRMSLNGVPCLCRYRFEEGYTVLSVLPEGEAYQIRNSTLYVNAFMEVLVFSVLFALVYLLVKHVVVNQIKDINHSLAKITGGNLEEIVSVRSSAEFASLSDDINSTVDTLKRYIAEASARIDKELEFASAIQVSALPGSFPAFPKRHDFDIFASMTPAREVGGDFYDFYMTDANTLHFLIADVSGKGIPAAMFMMRAKTELKSLTEAEMPISEVFTNSNQALCEGNDAGMFVTAWQGSIDLVSGLVRYANAGHNPPLIRRGDGDFAYLRNRPNFVLAGMDGVRYREETLTLEPGDILFLYTDGVTEATDANGVLYGEERLLQRLNSREYTSMENLCSIVRADVDAFVANAPQFDDITMVALRYIGPQADR